MEKTVNLKLPEVMEMGKEELKEVDGGVGCLAALGAIAFLYAVDVAVNFDDHVEAFKDGYNQVRNK